MRAIRRGLKIDSQHLELMALYRELGMREAPVLAFLDRSNPLNQILGRIRHSFRSNGKK